MEKPFWETSYRDDSVSTFTQSPSSDIAKYWTLFPPGGAVLDAGCGEGRNAIFLAKKGFSVDAFDISEAGVAKAKKIASAQNADVNFAHDDLTKFVFKKDYDVVISCGVLHLCEKAGRDAFIERSKLHTIAGGYNVITVFTNRLPATPDNAPFTKSLFDIGELPACYSEWEFVYNAEDIFEDEHPGGIRHRHAFERIVAKKK